nr:hypothetical protein [Leifsonia sp. Leaf325]
MASPYGRRMPQADGHRRHDRRRMPQATTDDGCDTTTPAPARRGLRHPFPDQSS